ncbi:MAG: DUF5060 domain-containing protein [Spirochaetes bacterium]|nr:DUF5060 domain-containing protein [Spirochaetota bacterium]
MKNARYVYLIIFFLLFSLMTLNSFQSKYTFEYKWESFERENLWIVDEMAGNAISEIHVKSGRSTHKGKSLEVNFLKKGTGLIKRVDLESFINVNAVRMDIYSSKGGTRFFLAFSVGGKYDYFQSRPITLEKGWNMNVTIKLDKNGWKKNSERDYNKYPEKLNEIKKLLLKFEVFGDEKLFIDNIRVFGKKIENNADVIPFEEEKKENQKDAYYLLDKATIPAVAKDYSVSINKDSFGKYILKYKNINNRERAVYQINQNIDLSDVSKIRLKMTCAGKSPAAMIISFQAGKGWVWYESPIYYLPPSSFRTLDIKLNAKYFKSERTKWGHHSYMNNKEDIRSMNIIIYGMPGEDSSGQIKITDLEFIKGKRFTPPETKVKKQYVEIIRQADYTPPEIVNVEHFPESIELYDKMEIKFKLFKDYKNPYNPDEIYCEAVFVSPDGKMHKVPAFFYEDFDKKLRSTGNALWQVRFTPRQTGKWSFYITAKNPAGDTFYKRDHYEFKVKPSRKNKGFINTEGEKFIFSNGKTYYPQGLNLCWIDRFDESGRENLVYSGKKYIEYLEKFKESDMNWTRIWNTPWGLIIEWIKPVGEGLGKYSQKNAFLFDQIIEYARKNDIHIQFVMNFHRMFDENYEWEVNPYNEKNGGPLKNPQDFFTDKIAKKYFKRRMLYTLARWGYSTSILSWELFNEADLTSNFDKEKVREWHIEMANYTKSIDSHDHLVTTSYSRPLAGMETFKLKEIDYSQTHIYTYDFKTALFTIPLYKMKTLEKPHVMGEIGGAVEVAEAEAKDREGIRLHNVLWYSFFSLASSSGMYWWWDEYVKGNKLFNKYEIYNELISQFDFKNAKTMNIKIKTKGIGDFFFAPILDWEKPTGRNFKLVDGDLQGEGYMSKYLHGKFQGELQIPTEFEINFVKDGDIQVMVEQTSPWMCNLTVSVDDTVLINKDFPKIDSSVPKQIDKIFSCKIKKGTRRIKIENRGNDWIKVNYIKFGNCIDDVEAYGVRDNRTMYVWLKNRKFNAENWLVNKKSITMNGTLVLNNHFNYKTVKVFFYDTWKNELFKVVNYKSSKGKIYIEYPAIQKDILLIVKKLEGEMSFDQ